MPAIHILGASGSGMSTLGKALSERFVSVPALFDLIVWLRISSELRIKRLKAREAMEFGPAGICTRSIKRFWNGQGSMMGAGWISAAARGKKNGWSKPFALCWN